MVINVVINEYKFVYDVCTSCFELSLSSCFADTVKITDILVFAQLRATGTHQNEACPNGRAMRDVAHRSPPPPRRLSLTVGVRRVFVNA